MPDKRFTIIELHHTDRDAWFVLDKECDLVYAVAWSSHLSAKQQACRKARYFQQEVESGSFRSTYWRTYANGRSGGYARG